jgi:hypothetical protein
MAWQSLIRYVVLMLLVRRWKTGDGVNNLVYVFKVRVKALKEEREWCRTGEVYRQPKDG